MPVLFLALLGGQWGRPCPDQRRSGDGSGLLCQLPDEGQQFLVIPWFLQESGSPCFQCAFLAGLYIAAGYHDDRDHSEIFVRSQFFQNDETVYPRQTEIENNHIGVFHVSFTNGVKSVFDEISVIT